MKSFIMWLIKEEYNVFDLMAFYVYMSVLSSPNLEAPLWFAAIVAGIIIFVPWHFFTRVLLPYVFRDFLR